MNDTPSHPSPAKKTSHKKWWLIGIFILLFVAAAAGSWYFTHRHPSSQTAQDNKEAERAQQINDTIGKAQELANNGKQSDAAKAYDDAANKTQDPYQKSILIMSKATLLFNDGKYDEALVVAKEAEKANENSTVTDFIAQIYEQKGDKKNAVTYYKKTIKLYDMSDPLVDEDLQYYKDKIAELGGGNA